MKLYLLFLLLSVSSLLLPLSSCTNTRRAATLHHIESIDSIMVKSLQSDTAYLNSRYSLTRQITVTKFRFDTIRKDWQPIRKTQIAMDEGLQLASTAATVSVSNTDSISTSSLTSARSSIISRRYWSIIFAGSSNLSSSSLIFAFKISLTFIPSPSLQ